ncbi:hypothetical protein C8F04DRAFT_701477 [Mycena alexandri]|uniref:Uncharacterized protein n=1 Tax=Mycena alexandri TaxID=1745969 RepID=A0AAD6X1G7_9AGAR|nr:hypothetical protein C8F04DRAFT_701477 [Mycena alexandri]
MSRIRFSYQGALTVAVWSDDPAERQIVFVTPVEDQPDSNWRPLGVTPTPTYTAQRLTIDMLAAACALHVGILGIPREAEAYVIAPSYRVHWIINRSVLGDELSATELLQNTLPNLAGSGVWIVPTKLPLPSLSVSRLSYLLTKAFRTHKADGPDGPRAADVNTLLAF